MTRNKMTVLELHEFLQQFPNEAVVEVVVNNRPVEFELLWGGCDGCTKETADGVCFSVGGTHESA